MGVGVMVGVNSGEAVSVAVKVGGVVSVGRAVVAAGTSVGAAVVAGGFEPQAERMNIRKTKHKGHQGPLRFL